MKTLIALLLSLCSLHAGVYGHFSGGIVSTKCPVPVGGQITFDLDGFGHINGEVKDDNVTIGTFTGTIDEQGRFRATNLDGYIVYVGRVRDRGGYTIFTGTCFDGDCRYKFQGRFRY